MKEVSAALFLLLLAGCRSEGPPGGGGTTHLAAQGINPDATMAFSVDAQGSIALTCRPECTGPHKDTLTIAANKNLQLMAPAGDLTLVSFELKNNSDLLPFEDNPATVVFRGTGTFNTRHSLPNGAGTQPYYCHVFIFDPSSHKSSYLDPLIIIGR